MSPRAWAPRSTSALTGGEGPGRLARWFAMVWPVCVVLVLVGLAAPAAAAPGPGVTGTAGPATVDWRRGLIIVTLSLIHI